MIILDATNRSLELVLSGAVTTNQLPFMACWVDHTTSAYTPGATLGASNSTTPVTIVAAPAASTQRSVKYINVKNNDTVAAEVIIQYLDNVTVRELVEITLQPEDTLQYVDTEGWAVIDTTGQKKSLVSIGTALPSGTNNIGDVDVLTLPAITGTVTANAGTNLNTSLLALEATQVDLRVALQIIDDWDEVDRAKVNLIAGQAGITAGAGAVGVSTPRVTLASDDPAVVALQILDNIVSGTEAQVDIVAALPAGTNNIGDVDVLSLPALAAGTNTIGNVGLAPRTSGGLTISRTISAASTNATSAKASAGQVYGWYLSNINAAVRYFKLYNKASAPTVGTDTPVMTIAIPGNTAGAGANVEFTNGIDFATGIAYALTTGVADADTGAVAANEIVVNLLYK